MSRPFKGVIDVDVTRSVPDWEPSVLFHTTALCSPARSCLLASRIFGRD
jgi:hypothetical protein